VRLLKVACALKDVFRVTYEKLWSTGLLLSSVGSDGKHNIMTFGWGLVGKFLSESVFMVAVRPTRYTHKLIEETNEFTVNVPRDSMEKIVKYCGEVSGRDHNKIKEMDLNIEKGKEVNSPIISDCIAHYECRVVGKTQIIPEFVSSEAKEKYELSQDSHTLYFGKILTVLTEKN
jgi:flavin reductase (DIM6/NTAB) family NADH-FMN oxidoreductase RutF